MKATFGVDLTDAMMRDGDEVPKILEVCTEAIESKGESSFLFVRDGSIGKTDADSMDA